MYELATLRHAFDGNNLPALILKIIRGVYPPIANSYSDHLKELIASLLRENPDHRPDIVDILRLPFLGPHVSKHRSLIAAAASSTPPPLPPPLPIVTSTTTFVAAPISTAVSVGLCALDTAAERGVAAILPSSPTRRARAHASAVAEASMSPASRDDAQSYVVGGELASGELGNRAFYFPQPPMLMVNQVRTRLHLVPSARIPSHCSLFARKYAAAVTSKHICCYHRRQQDCLGSHCTRKITQQLDTRR